MPLIVTAAGKSKAMRAPWPPPECDLPSLETLRELSSESQVQAPAMVPPAPPLGPLLAGVNRLLAQAAIDDAGAKAGRCESYSSAPLSARASQPTETAETPAKPFVRGAHGVACVPRTNTNTPKP